VKKKLAAILTLSILAFVFFQIKYDEHNNVFAEKNRYVFVPSAKTLEILSFGNVNLMTDLVYIWAIQFFATKSIHNRYDYAVEIFNLITELNPKFEPPYHIGSTIIGLLAKKPKKAIELLQKAKKYIKDNYYFDYDSAYFAWYYLKDYKLAKKYYLQMSEYKDLPDILKNFWINMDIKLADTIKDQKRALKAWEEIYKMAKGKYQRDTAKAHLLQIKFKIDKLRMKKYIYEFKKKFKRLPVSLDELKKRLRIKEGFLDYFGNKYSYDGKTGEITIIMEESWERFLR